MAAEASALRTFLKKEDIFDTDLESILSDLKISNPETDFKEFTQAQWDELWRRAVVERAKELKDQAMKVRLEKKLAKLEKIWRAQSGIKKTSINPDSKVAQGDEKEVEAANEELFAKAGELKKFLQANDCYSVELLAILCDHGVTNEESISNIKTNMEWGTISREMSVAQRKKNQDQASKARAEKLLTKFEKIWRKKTGIKSTSIKDSSKTGDAAPKDKKNAELAGKGQNLKSWLKKEGIWQDALYEELMALGVTSEEEVVKITEAQFDELVRKVRVERFKDLKEQKARQAADKLLVKFEKFWRKATGIKKTSIK